MRSRLFVFLIVAACAATGATVGAAPQVAAPALPTPEQIDASFADGEYPKALRQIGLALSAKGDMAALYDRHDLLVLKGETHLRLKNAAAAAEAFDEAARWTKDETKASVDRATAELLRRSRGGAYTPPAEKGEPAPDPVDVVDPAARKEAFASLFEQALPRVAAAAKAARQSNKLPVMYDALVTVRDLRALEVAATGEHPASAKIAADLGSRAVALMRRAVAERERTVTALEQSSSQIVQDVAFVGGRAEPVASGPRGLTPDETRQLRQIGEDCDRVGRLAADLRKMYDPSPEEADALRTLSDDADGVAARARDLANVNWKTYYRDDGTGDPNTLTPIRGGGPQRPRGSAPGRHQLRPAPRAPRQPGGRPPRREHRRHALMSRLARWPRDRSRLEPEWMDEAAADPDALRRSLAYIRRINTLLGYHRATLGHLERFSRHCRPGQAVRVLDVATGSGDLPRAVVQWARPRGFDVHVVGVDLHPVTLREAAARTPAAQRDRIRFARADALRLPFADGAFDYATCAMFLHHLDDEAAAAAVREMARVARRGIVVADLLRHRRAYAWITLFTALSSPMVKHDARTSVAQAFTKPEVLRLRDQAGVAFTRYYRHFGHRFVLAGEKGIEE